jgi:hypothetical protein
MANTGFSAKDKIRVEPLPQLRYDNGRVRGRSSAQSWVEVRIVRPLRHLQVPEGLSLFQGGFKIIA